jgi:ABC-2 type transport system permease protein
VAADVPASVLPPPPRLALPPASAVPGAGTVVIRQTARRALRSAVLWGYVSGLSVASTALSYAATYTTTAQREHLAALFGTNGGTNAIAGPGYELQTLAGFTVWKSLMFVTVAGAVWGLLLSTKLMRGEEDAGRWELLLAGETTPRRAASQGLAGLAVAWCIFFALTAVITVVVGHSSKVRIAAGPALFFSLALACGAAMFFAAGALASQLAPTRHRAASYAGTALGVAFVLRMVADSGTGLTWLRWVSPLGWVEQLQPLTSPRPLALLPIGGLVVVLCLLTVHLAGRRDLGASIIADRPSADARVRLLSGPAGLVVRLTRATLTAWIVAVALTALLMGLIAKSGGSALSASSGIEHLTSRLGVSGAGAAAYLGIASLIMAVLLTFVSAGQLSATRGEEAEGRLENVLVRPASRSVWLAGRLSVTTVALVLLGLATGVFFWLGAVTQDSGVGLPRLLAAGLNVVPPAIFVLGAGTLAFGIVPRATSAVAYSVLAWSILVEVVGAAVTTNHWLLDTSLFHQMAPAPATGADWTTNIVLTAVGVVAAVLGAVAFQRRDLAGE